MKFRIEKIIKYDKCKKIYKRANVNKNGAFNGITPIHGK